jgi:hydrogenase expression/formation protein HypC
MCLGVPGKVVEWLDRDTIVGRALVEFEGIRRVCHMACVPEAIEGDYVIVHAGVAISRVDAREAQRMLQLLAQLDDTEGWRLESGP